MWSWRAGVHLGLCHDSMTLAYVVFIVNLFLVLDDEFTEPVDFDALAWPFMDF